MIDTEPDGNNSNSFLPRSDAVSIWNSGVDAVRATPLVRQAVAIDGDQMTVADQRWSRADFDRIWLIGAGKAATAMAEGFLDAVGSWLPVRGWINVPEGTEKPLPGVEVHPARPAGINEPTEAGVRGTKAMLKIVSEAGPRDLCVALISGGGSALMPAPAEGITLQDKLDVTRWLSAAGADITELNVVRKHLSAVKGGRLRKRCRGGALLTLILSDVLGDPLDLIASGPTVPDRSTPEDALSVLRRLDPERKLPEPVYRRLANTSALSHGEPALSHGEPNVPVTNLVIGNNALAVDEAGSRGESLGYNHAMNSARASEGAAEQVGRHLASMAVRMLRSGGTSHRTDCLVTGGEPTVTLAPKESRGLGGRNQQLALAAYEALVASGLSDQEWARLAIVSGGTDGEDGPTDAAGAIVDQHVHRRAVDLRLDVADFLRRNDAYRFFEPTGGLLVTGPTGTNVCDLRVVVVR